MWHYRICKRKDKQGNIYFNVVEFYKNVPTGKGNKKTNLWSQEPEAPFGETKKELIECLKMMLKDCEHYSVLDETKQRKKDQKRAKKLR